MRALFRRHRRWMAWAALALTTVGAVVTIPAFVFVLSHRGGDATLPTDCAIVFGARVHLYGPGPGIERRIATAVRLYKEGQVQRLFLTGGRGDADEPSEASAMQALAVDGGVPLERLTVEESAGNTLENLRFTRPLVESAQCRGVVGISDDYHLARIEYLARGIGWELKTIPSDTRATRGFEAWSIAREVFALLYYGVRGFN